MNIFTYEVTDTATEYLLAMAEAGVWDAADKRSSLTGYLQLLNAGLGLSDGDMRHAVHVALMMLDVEAF